ncbi:LLM class F420-dependent oxidoreductase [Acidiferrimicrobium sp. IK]|uniref:LLM class F420-dependent oxidoreductase n=1 Tax=Acidiferrimicrobium sp. IK TaxID=2871700 RepID=UPI0021CB4A45|nr:LLM class F420-dependent oxidoreductase [Acidiferrimicrobium sp. IK]MCU4184173.1 LLM class F420-dependent oxidoreductase [Acidiferrimicrobium sp. IK]
MKLGLQLGYWHASPPEGVGSLVAAAEALGFDTVFAAESWGSDAFGPLAWWGSATSRIKLGTAIAQIAARTPASTAMHALTLDHLSGGRMVLGLGVSGPQVVEGWYGQPFAKPLARTREYVGVVRQVLARAAPVTSPGPHYPLPYRGEGSLGLGKSLRPITHPRRADLPILLGAEGPKNVALAAEIADGWLPIYYSPKAAPLYRSWLAEGFARPTARSTADHFEIAANCSVVVTDDRDGALDAMRPVLGFYIGGMGAKEVNFHKDVFARMGYEREADVVQDLFLQGRRDEAIAAVPRQLAADISLVGTEARIRDELAMWEDAGVTMLVVGATSVDDLRRIAAAVLG